MSDFFPILAVRFPNWSFSYAFSIIQDTLTSSITNERLARTGCYNLSSRYESLHYTIELPYREPFVQRCERTGLTALISIRKPFRVPIRNVRHYFATCPFGNIAKLRDYTGRELAHHFSSAEAAVNGQIHTSNKGRFILKEEAHTMCNFLRHTKSADRHVITI